MQRTMAPRDRSLQLSQLNSLLERKERRNTHTTIVKNDHEGLQVTACTCSPLESQYEYVLSAGACAVDAFASAFAPARSGRPRPLSANATQAVRQHWLPTFVSGFRVASARESGRLTRPKVEGTM